MNDDILLMHSDSTNAAMADDPIIWSNYFTMLQTSGCFDGGSAIGKGRTFRKSSQPGAVCEQLSGYIRIRASSPENAQSLTCG